MKFGPLRGSCALLLVALFLLPAEGEARRRNKKEDVSIPFKVVAVVPPRVEITRARVLGGVPKIETSLEAEDLIYEQAQDYLEEKGYIVRRGVLSRQRLEEDPDLLLAVSDLQDRWDQAWARIASSETPVEDIRSGRFNLGDQALLAAGIADVDGLVFLRGQGVSTGGGTKAAVFFLTLGGGVPGSGISIQMASVDGRTGRVWDVVGGSDGGPILKKTEKIVGKALRDAAEKVRPPSPLAPDLEEREENLRRLLEESLPQAAGSGGAAEPSPPEAPGDPLEEPHTVPQPETAQVEEGRNGRSEGSDETPSATQPEGKDGSSGGG